MPLRPNVETSGDQSPAISAQGSVNVTYNVQGTDAETAANVRELLAIARRGGIFRAADQNAISEAAVRAVVEKAGGIGIAGEDLTRWLEGWIGDVLAERAARLCGTNEGPAFVAARLEAQRCFDAGRIDEASQAFIDEFEREERAERERQEERTRTRIRLLEEAVEWDKLALNGPAAAEKLRRMAAIAHPDDRNAQAKFLFDRGGEYYEQGNTKGDNAALLVAIAAYRAAPKERTRERVPLDWAMTQNNLGTALSALGERESGTARLEKAVAAFRAALGEYTRDRVPLQWATTQTNLGLALSTLGARESGTARLEEAVAAYRAALGERTRDRVPLQWAMTQNNLGKALQTLGERESGTARLEEAVAAYRDALEEYTRDRVPLQWAGTQNNLGNALSALGKREGGTARLEEAVAAFRDALGEYTRDRVPLDWAYSKHGLANALAALAMRQKSAARMEEALTCMRDAAKVYQQGGESYWLPIAQSRGTEMEAELVELKRQLFQ
jgi:tetratricopeptide (TPR) repeat protein